jgi:lipid-A-disaccharide synthase
VVNVKYLGMPNLLADNEVIPEFIQHRAKPNAILRTMQPLIENAEAREQMISQLDAIVPKLGDVGASQRAARAIIEEIRSG